MYVTTLLSNTVPFTWCFWYHWSWVDPGPSLWNSKREISNWEWLFLSLWFYYLCSSCRLSAWIYSLIDLALNLWGCHEEFVLPRVWLSRDTFNLIIVTLALFVIFMVPNTSLWNSYWNCFFLILNCINY